LSYLRRKFPSRLAGKYNPHIREAMGQEQGINLQSRYKANLHDS
jgi:hypothetical protein